MNRLEVLAEAIANYNGYDEADSEAYQARNPGCLRAFSPKHLLTPSGLRIFKSFLDGYQAFLFDLAIKCQGKSRSKLTGDSTLKDLMRVYKYPESMARYVAKFCRKALRDDTIREDTKLSYFLEQ